MFHRMLWSVGLILVVSVSASAQDASVVGTVTDESKAVLPGATVTATERSTGRTFVDVANERGEYRILRLPPGRYEFKAELAGFSTMVLSDVELLVGQNATVAFVLKLATVQESVTVTGESPLVDLRSSQVSGNVDRRQMEELPIEGRNWMELSMMVKGITANSITTTPGVSGLANFQLNLDGQEITQHTSVTGFGQPGISRDAIAEYQVVTNLFDVSAGRSAGIQVQAVSRAGTNNLDGTFYGYFRDDNLNSEDPFENRVLPYSNQQVGGTIGGPIARDKMHFFASYEHEREPNTAIITPSALAPQRLLLPTEVDQDTFLTRIDRQFGGNDHLVVRGNYFSRFLPNDGISSHPSRGTKKDIKSYFATANWTHAGSSDLLQELRVGYYRFYWTYEGMEGLALTPEYQFPGLTIGLNWNYPEFIRESRLPIRYDVMWHRGKHDLKIGGEFIRGIDDGDWPARSRGQWFFSRLPADAARRFPLDQWNDPASMDFSGLDSIAIRFDQTYSRDWKYRVPRPTYAAWIGDTWTLHDRLTLNLGVRYDLAWGDFAPPGVQETELIINNGLFSENVGYRNDLRDVNNVAPRVGFNWQPTGSGNFAIRGGTGLFYAHVGANPAFDQQLWNGQKVIFNSYANDGRPGFIADPTRGVTADDILSGRVPLAPQSISVIAHDIQAPYSWQSMLGFQRQLTEVMGFDADLIYTRGYAEETQRDPNLFYDPATGLPKNPTTFGRPRPDFGPIRLLQTNGRSDYLALATSLMRRYRNNFQLGMTYTVMFFKHDMGVGESGYNNSLINPFDIEYNWARSGSFQRHTLRANGIWNLPWAFTIAGLFRYGSGTYTNINTGFNPLGGTGSNRFRGDLSFVPRNTFKQDPVQTFDVRVSKDFALGRGIKLSGIAEIFNIYNYARYSYNLIETSRLFQQRQSSSSDPRSVQLAFRLAF